jgi:hypothetical protein
METCGLIRRVSLHCGTDFIRSAVLAEPLLGVWACAAMEPVPGVDLRSFLDIIAFAFPFAWIFGRLGCYLVHDHPGVASDSWLAVRYPTGPRFDLGLIELLFTMLVGSAFLILERRRRPKGFYLGWLLVVYGPFRWILDGLHETTPHWLGLSPDRWFALGAMLAGLAVLAVCQARREGPVIRLNYAEAVTGTDSAKAPAVSISQIALWRQPGLVAGIALTLLAFPWGRQLARKCCHYRT